MNILVTGDTGFIGCFLVKKLRALGHDVDGFNSKNGDITDLFDVNRAVCGHDAVFHLAGVSRIKQVEEDPLFSYQVNVTGTSNVVMGCRSYDAKLIFASSELVYGENILPFTEDMMPFPVGEYGCQKNMAESMCFPLCDYIVRLGAVYGPNPLCHSVLCRFIDLIKNGKPVPMYTDDIIRDFIFVDDVVDALVLGLDEDVAGVFNVGCGVGTSLRVLADMISSVVGKRWEEYIIGSYYNDVKETCLDIDKIKSLGWFPKVDLKQGVERCLN